MKRMVVGLPLTYEKIHKLSSKEAERWLDWERQERKSLGNIRGRSGRVKTGIPLPNFMRWNMPQPERALCFSLFLAMAESDLLVKLGQKKEAISARSHTSFWTTKVGG